MNRSVSRGQRLRAGVLTALSAALFLSLVCSLSLKQGHADVPVAASAEAVQPLRAGDVAPRFVVRDVDGQPYHFDPDGLEQPVVIITFRGGWCPYCNMHLSELRHVIPEIRDLGAEILFLSGDRPDQLYASLEADTQAGIDGLGYTILSDADAQAGMAFGIAFRASEQTIRRRQEKGQDIGDSSMLRHGVLSVPSVFVIDADGRIAYDFVEPDYKIRLPAADLAAAVRAVVD